MWLKIDSDSQFKIKVVQKLLDVALIEKELKSWKPDLLVFNIQYLLNLFYYVIKNDMFMEVNKVVNLLANSGNQDQNIFLYQEWPTSWMDRLVLVVDNDIRTSM